MEEAPLFERNKHREGDKEPFSIVSRIKSFRHAYSGLVDILKTEHNAWVHAVMTVLVLLLAWWLGISFTKFALLLLVIISVWVAESFNTVVEMLVDIVAPAYSKEAKRSKDIAAAAVLIAVIGAVVLGVVLLGPPLIERIQAMF